MATLFWNRQGVLLIDFIERGATINSEPNIAKPSESYPKQGLF
jgi:hypothetical protein